MILHPSGGSAVGWKYKSLLWKEVFKLGDILFKCWKLDIKGEDRRPVVPLGAGSPPAAWLAHSQHLKPGPPHCSPEVPTLPLAAEGARRDLGAWLQMLKGDVKRIPPKLLWRQCREYVTFMTYCHFLIPFFNAWKAGWIPPAEKARCWWVCTVSMGWRQLSGRKRARRLWATNARTCTEEEGAGFSLQSVLLFLMDIVARPLCSSLCFLGWLPSVSWPAMALLSSLLCRTSRWWLRARLSPTQQKDARRKADQALKPRPRVREKHFTESQNGRGWKGPLWVI